VDAARLGDRASLVARGITGLEAAVREVRDLDGRAFVALADVAGQEALTAVAVSVEEAFGPTDVWINAADSSELIGGGGPRP